MIPTAHALEAELKAIAEGMAEAGGGVIQAILNVASPKPDLEMFCRIAAETSSALSFTLAQVPNDKEGWKDLLELTRAANEKGRRVTAQVFARPIGALLGLDASFHPFSAYPAYMRIADLPLGERVAAMRRPEVRAAILADTPEGHVACRSTASWIATRRYIRLDSRRTMSRIRRTRSPLWRVRRACAPLKSPTTCCSGRRATPCC